MSPKSKNNSEISFSDLTQKITKLLKDGIDEVRVIGELHLAFERLKQDLADREYFEQKRQ